MHFSVPRGAAIWLVLMAACIPAFAQSTPNLSKGQVPTAGQWNSYFAGKQDVLGFTPVNRSGDTMQGPLVTAAPSTTAAGLNLPPGPQPTAPNNGDVWTTNSGLFVRVNGSTIGPIATGTGSVTSVGQTVPSFMTVTGSPITTSGSLALSFNSQAAGLVLASPAGTSGAPVFRALVGADIPSPGASSKGGVQSFSAVSNQFLTGISVTGAVTAAQPSAANLSDGTTGSGAVVLSNSPTVTLANATGLPLATGTTGQLPIANGGSGQATANAALNAFLPAQTGNSGKVLQSDGSNSSWQAVSGTGTVTSVTCGTGLSGGTFTTTGTCSLTTPVTTGNGGTGLSTFTAANRAIYSTSSSALTAGTLPVLAGGTGTTTSIGTGSVVLSISPALTGTPTAPTAATGDNSSAIANTTFVNNEIAANVYAGSTLNNTVFPVGSYVAMYVSGTSPARNSTVAVYVSNSFNYLFSDLADAGGGAQLTGTWASRGLLSANSMLMQRIN